LNEKVVCGIAGYDSSSCCNINNSSIGSISVGGEGWLWRWCFVVVVVVVVVIMVVIEERVNRIARLH
jgi:hypothetical protein